MRQHLIEFHYMAQAFECTQALLKLLVTFLVGRPALHHTLYLVSLLTLSAFIYFEALAL